MRYYSDAQRHLKLAVFGVGLLTVLYTPSVAALQTTNASNVEVMVCPDASESRFTVHEPQSDTIVNEPKVQLRGDVAYISQIEFFIDDNYNHTVALGSAATDFTSSITLSPGTHTVKFVATDSCSQMVHTTSVVLTYEPKTQPSKGSDVVTEVDNRVTTPLGVTQPQPAENIIKKTIDTIVSPPVKAIGKSLDITPPDVDTPADVAMNTARAALFLSGATLVVAAAHIGAVTVLPQSLQFMNRFRWSGTSVVALLGSAMIALVFML